MITTFAAFFTAYYFVNIAGFHMVIKKAIKWPGRLKPFDCVTCLSVWIAVALFFLPNEISTFLLIIFSAGFIGRVIK